MAEANSLAWVRELRVEGPRLSYLDSSGRLRGLTVPTAEVGTVRYVRSLF